MLNPGHILDGKYEIINILGQGGMGRVYLCKNNRLGNLWAVKEVNSEWSNRIDFLAEPNILKNLSHTGIVRIIDIFHENNNLYIVEDYIEGKTLKEYIDANGPLSSKLTADISLQLCSILDYLHSFNPSIIYRDLKPSNIMVKPDNKVVLIDFGIARIFKEGQEGDTQILGSKGYIAPEQLVNVQSNVQTDIFSLGATMFFMLTGRSISLPTELMFDENYPDNADKGLIKVIKTASAIETSNRYKNIRQLISDLNTIIAESTYEKTKFMNFNEPSASSTNTNFQSSKIPNKRTKFIIIAVLALIIAAAVFLIFRLANKASDKKTIEAPTAPKNVEKTEPKPQEQPAKDIVEKDTAVRGVLDTKNPVVLNSNSGSSKAKGKDKTLQVQFALSPAASVSNSKLSISLTHIQVIDNDIIALVTLQNSSDPSLKLDLSKTYLLNGKNEARKSYNPNSTSLLAIPQGTGKQELKLYFKDFKFEGSTYILKTVLSSDINKDINLYIDIK